MKNIYLEELEEFKKSPDYGEWKYMQGMGGSVKCVGETEE